MTLTSTSTRAARTLAGTPESIGVARAWARACLPAGCRRADDLALVVSELVTNAVLHSASGGPDGRYELAVEAGPDAVEVTVVDQGPVLVPAMRDSEEGGRGLLLVRELAEAYEVVITSAGRTVWCRLTYDVPAGPA